MSELCLIKNIKAFTKNLFRNEKRSKKFYCSLKRKWKIVSNNIKILTILQSESSIRFTTILHLQKYSGVKNLKNNYKEVL